MSDNHIAVIHCFDNNYVAPAAVAFKTMLQCADKNRFYDLHVVTDSVSPQNKKRLKMVVSRFCNASLTFVLPPKDCTALFDAVLAKSHYSKDIIYKLLLPELFPEIDKAIVTDVDCLYLDDVAVAYDNCTADNGALLGGVNHADLPCRWAINFSNKYTAGYSAQEQTYLRRGIGAGFMVYNMALMRRENTSKKLMTFFAQNATRLIQPEQDVLNIVCRSRIQFLPDRNMVCTYLYDVLEEEEKDCWGAVLTSPVQLHYATGIKPWRNPFCAKSYLWWKSVLGTGFECDVVASCLRFQLRGLSEKLTRRLGI